MKWSEIGTEGWEEKLSNEISQLMREANENVAEAVVLAEQEFKERANKNEQTWIPVSERLPEKYGLQPQRIKGRWLRKESDLSWWYECSECGESPLFDPYENEVRTPFCPWCGARMEEEEDG